MKQEMKNKKGESMTAAQIVSLIIVLLGFAVLLYLIWQIGFSGRIDRDTCHTSVVIRGTLPITAGLQDYAPLKCATKKVCVTSGLLGGKCEDYGSEKGISYVRVSSGDEGLKQVQQFLAQEIVDCWSMMGEGKISIFSQWMAQNYGIGGVYPSCVICDRVSFDRKTLEGKGVDLGKMNLDNYMKTHLVPNKNITYLDFIAGENAKISIDEVSIPQVSVVDGQTVLKDGETAKLERLTPEQLAAEMEKQKADRELQSKELAIMFMQISAPTQGGSLANIGKMIGVGTATSFALAPGPSFSIAKSIGTACGTSLQGAAVCTAIAAILTIGQQGNVAYNRAVTAGYCGDVNVGTEARNGCSVVRTVHYDVADITKYCSVMESIP